MPFRQSTSSLTYLVLYLLLFAIMAACQQLSHSKHAHSSNAVGKRAHDWASGCMPEDQTQHIKFTGHDGMVFHTYVPLGSKNNTLQGQETRVQCKTGANDHACIPCVMVLGHVELMKSGMTCILAFRTNTGHTSIELLSKSDGRRQINGSSTLMDVFCYSDNNDKVSREL